MIGQSDSEMLCLIIIGAVILWLEGHVGVQLQLGPL